MDKNIKNSFKKVGGGSKLMIASPSGKMFEVYIRSEVGSFDGIYGYYV